MASSKPSILCLMLGCFLVGAGVYGGLVGGVAESMDLLRVRLLLLAGPSIAIALGLVCMVMGIVLQGRVERPRAAGAELSRGRPEVAHGLIVQAIHTLLPVGDVAKDTVAARRVGDAVLLLEGASALLERDGGEA
jgi:hypothetical protein